MHNVADGLNNVFHKEMVFVLHTYIAYPQHFSYF